VTSEPGQGTTFAFRVPLAVSSAPVESPRPQGEAQDLAAFVAARGRGVRILVVEDNVTNQFVARSILKVDGIHVDVAANGYEAIEAVTRHGYDLVFMDLQMPEMDGLTATKSIRARGGRFAELPIVAFSANAYASDIEACAAAGMNGHVAKPVQKETLRSAVIDALSGRTCGGAAQIPAGDTTDAPEFDRRAVDALIEGLTLEVVEELLTSFVRDSKVKIERLPELLDNHERLTIEVHALKSAGAQVGAMQLSRLAAALEQRALAREAIGREELTALKTALDGYGAQLALVVRPLH
jgi:CheY-like chemotaxis protein